MTSGIDVSTDVTYDTSPTALEPERTEPERPEHVGEPSSPSPARAHAGRGRLGRTLRTAGFHLGALALFAIPAVALWWHVWSGHPSSTLTCGCGDPAQQVWFTAWPAWAMAHLHSLFFSGAVNVPDGANLLSNTSGTLVGVVLAPVTWAFGPVTATNVALTLAPALSAWGCFAAIRPLVTWKAGAIPGALVYGYSSAIVTSLMFGHVSMTVLVIPPFLFTTMHEIVIRQVHSARRDGLLLAALLVAQFLISPEVGVMCLLLTALGLLAVVAVGWRQVRVRSAHAVRALGLGAVVTAVLLAYPVWFGLAGPQAVTGVLFAIAPLTGLPFSGVLEPGQYAAFANDYVRFGGYLGRNGPPPDYLGGGVALATLASVVAARRRPLTWLLVWLAAATFWLALGPHPMSAPSWLAHLWLPWNDLSKLPLLDEILPDQFAPFLALFVAFMLALGLDALYVAHRRRGSWMATRRRAVVATATALVAVVALVPVFVTFGLPLRVVPVQIPHYLRSAAPALPAGTVLATIPFAVSGSSQPMLWQAVDGMHFRLAGAALKTPNALGRPVQQGPPGSARRIMTDLSAGLAAEPAGTPAQLATVRHALQEWQVGELVIAGTSRNPVYASGFFTMALGMAPAYEDGAWVWALQSGRAPSTPAIGASLALCRSAAAAPAARSDPLAMAQCVLHAAGRS